MLNCVVVSLLKWHCYALTEAETVLDVKADVYVDVIIIAYFRSNIN